MKFSLVSSLGLFAFPATIHAVSLLDALAANGASSFAKQIQANPDILALYTSTAVRTVYAVPDVSFTNATLQRRQDDPQQLQLHCSNKLTDLEAESAFPGTVSPSNLNSPQLHDTQAVVSQSGLNNTSSSRHRRQTTNGTLPSTSVTLASGLGNQVNLVRGDIAYDGGLIHIVDGFFTVPVSLSKTINSTGLNSFQAALAQANLSDTLNERSSITIFTPSDEAFAAASKNANQTLSGPELQKLLLNHVIPDFTGYLPLLKDGATYTTLAGSTLTVTIKNSAYFINGVRIISPNTITTNGVGHVINGLLNPSPPAFEGAGWSPRPAYSIAATIAAVLFVQFGYLIM